MKTAMNKTEQDVKDLVKKIGVQKVALKAGLHYQTLYRWIKGALSPTLKTYSAICAAVDELKDNPGEDVEPDWSDPWQRIAKMEEILGVNFVITKMGKHTDARQS